MAQLVERTARLEISPPVAAPSATLDAAIARASPPEAAEAVPLITLDVDAIAQAIFDHLSRSNRSTGVLLLCEAFFEILENTNYAFLYPSKFEN